MNRLGTFWCQNSSLYSKEFCHQNVPNLLKVQQISRQILVDLTESGGNIHQNVQQIFTNLVSVPVSHAFVTPRAPGSKAVLGVCLSLLPVGALAHAGEG